MVDEQIGDAAQPVAVTIVAPGREPADAPGHPAAGGARSAAGPLVRTAWLRSADNSVIPLLAQRTPGMAGGTACRFSRSVPPGSYLLCASVGDRGLHFPARPIHLEAEPTELTFEVIPADRPYFRLGQRVIGYRAEQQSLAAVLLDGDVDDRATARLCGVLGEHGYERVIDLTRVQADAWRHEGTGDPLVMEFRPTLRRPTCTADAGQLVRNCAAIAHRAGLTAAMVRLGRLVNCELGRLVLDNEVVLGFARGIDRAHAERLVTSAGGHVLEDLSDHEDRSLIFVARFPATDPEGALALSESWLDDGVLHWVEPNVVEH